MSVVCVFVITSKVMCGDFARPTKKAFSMVKASCVLFLFQPSHSDGRGEGVQITCLSLSGDFFFWLALCRNKVEQKVRSFFGWLDRRGQVLRIHALSPASGRSPYDAIARYDLGSPQTRVGCPVSCSRQRRRGPGDA